MAVERTPGGRFRAKVKQGRTAVASKTFDTRREAQAWHDRQKRLLAGGYDPRSGRVRVRVLVGEWADHRDRTVAAKTARTDRELMRLLSPALGALSVGSVQSRHVEQWLTWLGTDRGLARASVVRYRASLLSFWSWAVREGYAPLNPVRGVRVPRAHASVVETARPFAESELDEVYEAIKLCDAQLAGIVLIAGWTGLRWGELRSMQVEAFQRVPSPGLRVTRSQTEGGEVKPPKSYEQRRVPVADRVLPLVEACAAGKDPTELLFTGERGGQLWRGSFVRATKWSTTGRGRRLHDLRHTAACLWLARGVDAGTVQAWMGHESIRTTNRYLHFLGTASDRAGLALLNAPSGSAGGPDREEGVR